MKISLTTLLLIISNIFMTLAWYGHLQFKKLGWFQNSSVFIIILISWGLAFFEYCFQVPANRIGSQEYGGPMSLFQLKILQEVITLVVFTVMAIFVFKTDTFRWNHVAGFMCMILAVYFIFRK
ncbi:MAG TPA: DMT family protein [Chitinophagales bacterium]|nr:DMT family protein [Chitinophagales bacterium]